MKKILLLLSMTLLLSNYSYTNENNLNDNTESESKNNSFIWKEDLKLNLTNKNTNWVGIGPDGEAENTVNLRYTRIPSMIITNDNKLVVMFDLRWNGGGDQTKINPGVAISKDGGHTWEKKTAWLFNESTDNNRRVMDSTMLYDPIEDEIYALHGTWKSGNQNWYRDRINYFNNNIWSAMIYKSKDGGETWKKHTEFNKNVNFDTFSKHLDQVNPVVGFLGGVGTGIVMRNGTLVFPIQTAHRDNKDPIIGATIMYSTDRGKTWKFPETQTYIQPNKSSLENMVFEIDDKLVLTGRGNNRWAYYSTDMGVTWSIYEPVNGFSGTTAQPSQGSSIYVTLPNGRKVLLVSKPNGNNDSWARGNLALWVLDARNKDNKYQVHIVRPGSGNPEGAGYSSLAYKNGNLFIAYEDDGDITVENLTRFISVIEEKSIEWNLPDERKIDKEKVDNLENLNNLQKDYIKSKLDEGDDNYNIIANVLDREIGDLKSDISNYNNEVDNKDALPSKIKKYENKILEVDKNLFDKNSGNNLNIFEVRKVKEEVDNAYKLLDDNKLNFSNYLNRADLFTYYDKDIIYNFDDNLYASYGFKYNNKYNNNVKLGLNYSVNNNLKIGTFFEYDDVKLRNLSAGINFKYNIKNNDILGFVRYRNGLKKEVIEDSHNLDAYIQYSRKLEILDKFNIKPSIGFYTTFLNNSKIDEDVKIDNNVDFVTDLNVKFEYLDKKGLKISLTPEIMINKNDKILSQTNKKDNKYKIESKLLSYQVKFEIEKEFKNKVKLGSDLKINGFMKEKPNISANAKVSYNW